MGAKMGGGGWGGDDGQGKGCPRNLPISFSVRALHPVPEKMGPPPPPSLLPAGDSLRWSVGTRGFVESCLAAASSPSSSSSSEKRQLLPLRASQMEREEDGEDRLQVAPPPPPLSFSAENWVSRIRSSGKQKKKRFFLFCFLPWQKKKKISWINLHGKKLSLDMEGLL